MNHDNNYDNRDNDYGIDDELDKRILGLASDIVSDELQNGEGAIATAVVMLVQYIGPDGKTYDSFFHGGNPRFSQILGMMEAHNIRVNHWFIEALEEDEA